MAVKSLNTRIMHKSDLEYNWEKAQSFRPLKGELIIYKKEIDENGQIYKAIENGEEVEAVPAVRRNYGVRYFYDRFKVGDGYTLLKDLPFVNCPYVTSSDNAISLFKQPETTCHRYAYLTSPNFASNISIDDFHMMPIGNKVHYIYKITCTEGDATLKNDILKNATFDFTIFAHANEMSYTDCPVVVVKPELWLSDWTFDLLPQNSSTTFNSSSDVYNARAAFKIHAPKNITAASTGDIYCNTNYVIRINLEKIDDYTLLVEPEFYITGVKA